MISPSSTLDSVCLVGAEDTHRELSFYVELRAPEFAAAGLSPADLTSLLTMQFRAQAAQLAAEHPRARRLWISRNGETVGWLMMAASQTTVNLLDFALLSTHRGQGIGSQVLSGVCDNADANAQRIALTVWQDNAAAQRLYSRFGFVTGVRNGGYLSMHRPAPDGIPERNV